MPSRELGQAPGGPEGGRVGVDAARQQVVADRHPLPHLLRQPPGVAGVGGVGRGVRGRLGGRRHGRAAADRRGPGARPEEPRQVDEALGHARRRPDQRDVARLGVAEEAGLPERAVLHVGAVQRLDLPPARRHQQQPPPQPQHRAGADPRALLEGGAEDGEVQRDPPQRQLPARGQHGADHQLGDPVVGLRVPPHEVEGEAVGPPGHEGEQAGDGAPLLDQGVGEQRLDHQAVAVGGVAQPAQRHREPALGLGVAPGLDQPDEAASSSAGTSRCRRTRVR